MRHMKSLMAIAEDKIVLDDYCVHYVCSEYKFGGWTGKWVLMDRKEFTNEHKQLCIKNALKWVNA